MNVQGTRGLAALALAALLATPSFSAAAPRRSGKVGPPLAGTTVPLPGVLEPHRTALEKLLVTTIRLEPGGAPVARFGGLPRLPGRLTWPSSPKNPMSFIGEIDLADLHAAAGSAAAARLPRSGRLALFYDVEEMRWGGEPDDARYFKVLLLRGGTPRAAPKGATTFKERQLGARVARVLPDAPPRGWSLKDPASEAWFELAAALAPEPDHRLGGPPGWIQGEELPGPDWSLLWQIDSDAAAGFMWGDTGRLYLLARDADLAALHLDRVALILQCY
jgi:hypothetical protein